MLSMRRLPSLSVIFEKDETGCYTKPAHLYQDILCFSLNIGKTESGESESFRHWDLAKWLMKNNPELVNRYKDPSNSHTNISNRIENTQQRTKGALSDLKDLRLVRLTRIEPQLKGTGTVQLYKFRRPAFLLAWLIEGTKPVERNRANDEIFKLLDSYFNGPYAPPMEIYELNLYSKFRSKGVFGELVVDNIREMCEISNATDIDQFLDEILPY
jgi:hypothetical protein